MLGAPRKQDTARALSLSIQSVLDCRCPFRCPALPCSDPEVVASSPQLCGRRRPAQPRPAPRESSPAHPKPEVHSRYDTTTTAESGDGPFTPLDASFSAPARPQRRPPAHVADTRADRHAPASHPIPSRPRPGTSAGNTPPVPFAVHPSRDPVIRPSADPRCRCCTLSPRPSSRRAPRPN